MAEPAALSERPRSGNVGVVLLRICEVRIENRGQAAASTRTQRLGRRSQSPIFERDRGPCVFRASEV